MHKKLLSLHGLKFNPFSAAVPSSALFVSEALERFCWRIEQQAGEGGFALISGEPGTGKSAALRVVAERVEGLRDLSVGVLSRPQASVSDFYRELGELFGVPLTPRNRWGGSKALREKWSSHIEASLYRPMLLVDEAQEMLPAVLSELRLLSSTELDSQSILTVLLAGDHRLVENLQSPELLPLASRIRSRLRLPTLTPKELSQALNHLLKEAGNPRLLSDTLIHTLSEHAAGNLRVLMNLANELLSEAVQRQIDQLDEKLFFEVFDLASERTNRRKRKQPN